MYEKSEIYTITDMDAVSDGFADVYVMDDKEAYVAYFSDQQQIAVVSCTEDGNTAAKATLDYTSYGGPGSIYLSFYDDANGYLLYCSDPAASQMTKVLWATSDGGDSYQLVGDITDGVSNYPTDMAFVDETTGMIPVSNHGVDAYAYITNDGGKTWEPYEAGQIREGLSDYNYLDGVSIQRTSDGKQWELTVKAVSDESSDLKTYVSADGWKTWN